MPEQPSSAEKAKPRYVCARPTCGHAAWRHDTNGRCLCGRCPDYIEKILPPVEKGQADG